MSDFNGDEVDHPRDLDLQLSSSSCHGFVNYSCSACGYNLNLNSSNRHTLSVIGSEYGKFVRRGILSFFSIDESRFIQTEEVKYWPYFTSKRSWGLLRRRTKLLCRKCSAHVGNSDIQRKAASSGQSWDGLSDGRIFNIKIRALQPSSMELFVK